MEKIKKMWNWRKGCWERHGFFLQLNDLDDITEEFALEKINECIKEDTK